MSELNIHAIGIALLLLIVAVSAPLINVQVEIPYTELETKHNQVASMKDRIVSSDNYVVLDVNLVKGANVSFSFFANSSLDAYIFNFAQYYRFKWIPQTGLTFEKKIENALSGKMEYAIPLNGTYYFVLLPNLISGSNFVIVDNMDISLTWEESIIKSRVKVERVTLLQHIIGQINREIYMNIFLMPNLLHIHEFIFLNN
jgi:hypothetical protein